MRFYLPFCCLVSSSTKSNEKDMKSANSIVCPMDGAAWVYTGEGQKVELTELVMPGLEAVRV